MSNEIQKWYRLFLHFSSFCFATFVISQLQDYLPRVSLDLTANSAQRRPIDELRHYERFCVKKRNHTVGVMMGSKYGPPQNLMYYSSFYISDIKDKDGIAKFDVKLPKDSWIAYVDGASMVQRRSNSNSNSQIITLNTPNAVAGLPEHYVCLVAVAQHPENINIERAQVPTIVKSNFAIAPLEPSRFWNAEALWRDP
ncbi:MAG: hypothetical protein JST89_06150 [Cyanobacteria bacterium SZAS-4]|nr:hypothetical protein [Cyanobacteria bacterium SZAS-4]